jgi:catechol 2,3-dioxygenase-like lactoylglutathione lyase family enzyme
VRNLGHVAVLVKPARTVPGSGDMNPRTEGILESSLYVTDVVASAQFYEKIFGFRVISDFGERGCAMGAGNRQVLLLFKKGGSREIQSPHDAMANFISYSPFPPRSWRSGSRGWRGTESRSRRSVRGTGADVASISEILTGT